MSRRRVVVPPQAGYPYEWFWRIKLPERKGDACRLLERRGSQVLIEFEDGHQVLAPSYAIRRSS